MNTIVDGRVLSDPRFFHLTRELGDPCKAIGALVYCWYGTQNRKLVTATLNELLDCFPPGYRGAKSAISALIVSGWLQTTGEAFVVTGNEEHVLKKEEISQRNKDAANARWNALRMRQASEAQAMRDASGINPASARHATLRSDPIRTDPIQGRESATLPPQTDSLREIASARVGLVDAQALFQHWREVMIAERKITPELIASSVLLGEAGLIVALAAGDLERAKRAVTAMVKAEDQWWAKRRWALDILADGKQFNQAELCAGAAGPAPKPKLSGDERHRQYEQQLAEEKARNAARNKAEDEAHAAGQAFDEAAWDAAYERQKRRSA